MITEFAENAQICATPDADLLKAASEHRNLRTTIRKKSESIVLYPCQKVGCVNGSVSALETMFASAVAFIRTFARPCENFYIPHPNQP